MKKEVSKLIEFLVKYWLEVVFGLVCAGVSFVARHYYKLVKDKKKTEQQKVLDSIDKKFEKQTEAMASQMGSCYANMNQLLAQRDEKLLKADEEIHAEINILRDGVLSLQGREFKADCRYLLSEGHRITLNEYENIVEEHRVYNALKGNHEGDALFKMVQAKYQQTLGIDIKEEV